MENLIIISTHCERRSNSFMCRDDRVFCLCFCRDAAIQQEIERQRELFKWVKDMVFIVNCGFLRPLIIV